MRDLKAPASKGKIRENRRKQQKQPRDWRKLLHRGFRVLLFAGSCVVLIGGGALAGRMLLDWGYFRIETVRVEENRRVSRDEILALSNIELGTGIFDIDLERIGRKIEENPWIATAQVERRFPRGVVIRVNERVPRAIVSLGYLYYVDGGGEIFKLLEAEDRLDLPVITGIDPEQQQKQGIEVREELREALALVDELHGRHQFNLEDVSEVHIDSRRGIDLITFNGGIPVRLGYGDYARKLDRLEKIFAGLELQLQALKYIDLNVTDRVIVRVDGGLKSVKG